MPPSKRTGPSAWIAGRLKRCREAMGRRRIAAYLLTRHTDTYYMTGFTGEDSAVIVTPRAVHLVSDGRFDQTIDQEVPWARKHLRKGLLMDEIATVCRKLDLERLAVQADGLTVESHAALRRRARPTRIVKAPPIVNNMRRLKDATELKTLRRAIVVAEGAFQATRRTLRIGQTEHDLAARLEYEMRQRGSSAPAFETICAVGANAAHPHARPGNRRIKRGSAVLFDWGATVGFYRSDLTRCLFVGRIPPQLGGIYKIVLDAQMAAIDAIAPGERMCDVDAVARGIIAKAGHGGRFVHGLGHGLGLNVHEPPALSWRSKERLEVGDLVTVEPGIYLPGVGGIRIEDDILVTANGCRVLSSLSKDLQSAVV